MDKNKYQIDNFIFEVKDNGDGTNCLEIRTVANDWKVVYEDRHALFTYWVNVIEMARGSLGARKMLEATITVIYQASNVGVHDMEATEQMLDAIIALQKRIASLIEKNTSDAKKAEEAKDDADWEKNSSTLDEMQEESEKMGNAEFPLP